MGGDSNTKDGVEEAQLLLSEKTENPFGGVLPLNIAYGALGMDGKTLNDLKLLWKILQIMELVER